MNLLLRRSKEKIDAEYLSKIYGIDFLHPKPSDNHTTFFALRDQLLLIEKFLNMHHVDQLQIPDCQKKIRTLLLSNQPYLTKIAELGLIYYYLDRNGSLPHFDSTALDYRASEIEDELQHLRNNHLAACQKTKLDIPSGKTHYLLRAFSHCSSPPNKNSIVAVACALRTLLTDPKYEFVPTSNQNTLITLSSFSIASSPNPKSLPYSRLLLQFILTWRNSFGSI